MCVCVDELKGKRHQNQEINVIQCIFYTYIYIIQEHTTKANKKTDERKGQEKMAVLLFFIFDKCENAKKLFLCFFVMV